ncbi:MAG: hypothetical protein U0360_02530 [Dehalococcoidia bacterium]
METRTFRAASVDEAYEMVRAALGEDAMIVSTHTLPRLGGTSEIEIVAARPAAVLPVHRVLASDFAAHAIARSVAEDAAAARESDNDPDGRTAFVNPMAGAWRQPPEALPPLPLDDVQPAEQEPASSLIDAIAGRTRVIESAVQWLAAQRAADIVEGGPPAFREVHARLVDHGVPPRLLIPLVRRLEGQLRVDISTREALRATERTLASLFAPPPALDFDRAGQVVFVVGPHGAGKSSVAVRLAREIHGPRRAIVAGTDVDRAGAPQQLMACAAAAGVEARLCYTPSELRALLRAESSNVVIVDTVAHSGARSDRMAELKAYAALAPQRITLEVLPATINASDALRTTAALSALDVTALVVTRVDEATGLGGVAATMLKSGLGLAFTTASEEPASGLALGDNHALALAVLTGLWPARRPAAVEERAGVSR